MTGPFVPIEELAKHFSVSVSTIRAWVRQGNIPKDTYIKVGNTYRFCVGDVSKALTAQEEAKKTRRRRRQEEEDKKKKKKKKKKKNEEDKKTRRSRKD